MKVGRYEVTGFLGRGGMAEVFKCSLSGIGGFDKTIVVKRMLPNLIGDPQFVQMFLDEARLVARLSHPNIVQVFEVGEMEGVPFLAMEYIHGPTLRQVVRQVREARSQNLGHMVKILSGIALALDYAHNAKDTSGESLGIVHRDVSPHNIIVSTQGVAKLLDFGVAKAAGRLSHTKGSAMKGKLAYMAPEQTDGQVDFRTDIFALGVCLYEASLLRRPFKGNNEAEVLQAVMKGVYVKPREIVPAFPERLEEIIGWAMQADPDARCPSARILHNALENFISRGEYPSDTESLQAWIGELFPDPSVYAPKAVGDAWELANGSRSSPGSASGSASMPGSHSLSGGSYTALGGSQLTPSQSVIIEKRSALPWIISMIAVAVAAGIGGILYMKSQNQIPTSTAPQVTPDAKGDVAARRFLDEIDRLLKQKKYARALDLSKKVEALKVTDAGLDIRRARTIEEVETVGFLAMARMALTTGDTRGAIELAKKVLERDFENTEARALIVKARGEQGESPLVEESNDGAEHASASGGGTTRPHPRRGRRAGSVSLSSTPPAMLYVDDLPVGQAPLARLKLTPGTHQIEFRAEGYQPATRSVKVRTGKNQKVAVELQKMAPVVEPDVEAPKPASAAVRPPPVPAPEKRVTAADATPPPIVAKPTPPPAVKPAPVKPGKPRLPKIHTLRSRKDIGRVFGVIEKEIVARGHVSPSKARNVTAPLARQIYASFAPGSTVDVYPQGMYWLAVDLDAAGKAPAQVAAALVKAHRTGKVRSYRPKSR